MFRILVINPGSTSTKVAVYEDEKQLFVKSIEHDDASLAPFENIGDQYGMRRDLVMKTLDEYKIDPKSLSAVVARGGLLPPVESGAFMINEPMLKQLRHKPQVEHISNIAAAIAYSIAEPLGLQSYVYDPVSVDELIPLVKIVGLPGMRRKGMGHNLNMRATAIRYAKEKGLDYKKLNLVVVHMGGGSTLSLHHGGRMIDMISDDEGQFSPERAGGLPCYQLVDLCYEVNDKKKVMKMLRGQGGLMAWFGVTDAREVEARIDKGDQDAALIYEAMALAIAKNIAKISVVVRGKLDAILLTGGLAHSKRLTGWIGDRVSFLAPVVLMPGENEMESLAAGALRVLRGEERAKTFVSEDFPA